MARQFNTSETYSVDEFADIIRNKYPKAYDSWDNNELVSKWMKKYPVYEKNLMLVPSSQLLPYADHTPTFSPDFKPPISSEYSPMPAEGRQLTGPQQWSGATIEPKTEYTPIPETSFTDLAKKTAETIGSFNPAVILGRKLQNHATQKALAKHDAIEAQNKANQQEAQNFQNKMQQAENYRKETIEQKGKHEAYLQNLLELQQKQKQGFVIRNSKTNALISPKDMTDEIEKAKKAISQWEQALLDSDNARLEARQLPDQTPNYTPEEQFAMNYNDYAAKFNEAYEADRKAREARIETEYESAKATRRIVQKLDIERKYQNRLSSGQRKMTKDEYARVSSGVSNPNQQELWNPYEGELSEMSKWKKIGHTLEQFGQETTAPIAGITEDDNTRNRRGVQIQNTIKTKKLLEEYKKIPVEEMTNEQKEFIAENDKDWYMEFISGITGIPEFLMDVVTDGTAFKDFLNEMRIMAPASMAGGSLLAGIGRTAFATGKTAAQATKAARLAHAQNLKWKDVFANARTIDDVKSTIIKSNVYRQLALEFGSEVVSEGIMEALIMSGRGDDFDIKSIMQNIGEEFGFGVLPGAFKATGLATARALDNRGKITKDEYNTAVGTGIMADKSDAIDGLEGNLVMDHGGAENPFITQGLQELSNRPDRAELIREAAAQRNADLTADHKMRITDKDLMVDVSKEAASRSGNAKAGLQSVPGYHTDGISHIGKIGDTGTMRHESQHDIEDRIFGENATPEMKALGNDIANWAAKAQVWAYENDIAIPDTKELAAETLTYRLGYHEPQKSAVENIPMPRELLEKIADAARVPREQVIWENKSEFGQFDDAEVTELADQYRRQFAQKPQRKTDTAEDLPFSLSDGTRFSLTPAQKQSIEMAKENVPENKAKIYERGTTKGYAQNRLYSQIENSGGNRIVIKNKDGIEGYINKNSASKIVDATKNSVKNGFTQEQHWAAAADIVNLYENSTKVLTHPDEKGKSNIEAINRFVAPLYGDNYALITGKEIISEGRKIHSLELAGIGKLDGILAGIESNSSRAPATSNPKRNIETSQPTTASPISFSLASAAGIPEARKNDPKVKDKAAQMWREKGTDSPFFKRWFGDSKVVDEQGKPLVVYHGTNAEFTEFKNKNKYQNIQHEGYFFGDKETAGMFGNGELMPVYLNIDNPYIVDVAHEIREYGDEYPETLIQKWEGKTRDDFETGRSAVAYFDDNIAEIYDRAKEDGSNGIIVYGTDGSINIIAFEPTQIKSATDNAGTFDGSSPDIRYSLSPTKAEKETSQWKIYRAAYNFFDNQGIRGSLPTKVERHGEAINKWKKTGGAEGKNYEDIDKMAERFASDNEEIAHMIQTNRELDGDKMLEMALDYERNRKLGRKENSEDAALREEREAWEQSEEGKAATQEEAAEKSESAQKKLQELPTWHKGRVQKEGFFRKIVREQITDRIDLKDLGVALNLDFDDAIEVAPGRIKHGISNLKKNFLDPILEIIKNHEFDYEIVDNYLYALQAKDRNKYIRDKSERKVDDGSGHTDKWADDILAEFDKLPASKKDGLKAIAGKNIELNNLKMRLLVESGLMSQETANNLKKIYPNYVPLRGLPKDINDMMNNSSFGVAKGLLAAQDNKRAYGRKSAAEDVLMQNIALAQNAIINAERNMAIREIWDGATKNPNKKYWEQNPEINDTRFGEKHYDANASTQENVMKVYIDGKANYLKFYTEDGMRIANHIKGLDKSIAGDIIGWLGKMNRFISKVVTSYSPKFVAKNAIRDYQTASTQAYIRYGGDVAAKMLKDIPINLIKLSANKAVPNEMGKWADRFSAAGGEISLVETLSFNDKVTELLKTVEDMQRSKANPIKIIHKVIAGIEGVNSVIENNTRITLFKILVEKGMSDRKAAVAAKHISTNFNQAGSKGREFNKIFMFYNAAVQGIYGSLIGHAGINPADRRFDPAIRKRQLQADAVWIMAFGAGLYGIDYALSDDGENKRNGQLNVPDHVRKSNFVSPVKNGNYITIPMSREFAFFANLGARTARKMLHEDFTAMMFAGATIADFLDNYNPFGSDIDVANPDKSFTRNVNPAFFKPIMDIYVNEDFAGRQIHPEDSNPDSNTPDSHLVYNKRVTPWVRKMAQGLNRLTGGDEHIKGSIDFNPHNFEHLIRSYAGGMGTLILQGTAQMSDERKTLDWNQKPFADIFLKSINPAANRVEVNRTIKETSGYYKRWDIRDNGDGENDAEIAEKLLDRDYGRIKLYEALKELRADARDDFKEENIEHMTAYAKAVAATDKVMRLQKTLDETKNTELREALKKDIDATLEPLDEYLE